MFVQSSTLSIIVTKNLNIFQTKSFIKCHIISKYIFFSSLYFFLFFSRGFEEAQFQCETHQPLYLCPVLVAVTYIISINIVGLAVVCSRIHFAVYFFFSSLETYQEVLFTVMLTTYSSKEPKNSINCILVAAAFLYGSC